MREEPFGLLREAISNEPLMQLRLAQMSLDGLISESQGVHLEPAQLWAVLAALENVECAIITVLCRMYGPTRSVVNEALAKAKPDFGDAYLIVSPCHIKAAEQAVKP